MVDTCDDPARAEFIFCIVRPILQKARQKPVLIKVFDLGSNILKIVIQIGVGMIKASVEGNIKHPVVCIHQIVFTAVPLPYIGRSCQVETLSMLVMEFIHPGSPIQT